MKFEHSDSIALKLVLPLFSAVLIGQLMMAFTKLYAVSLTYLFFLIISAYVLDIVEQARVKTNGPMLVSAVAAFLVYLVGNLVLRAESPTTKSLLYIEGMLVPYICLLVSVYWGISHGNMVSRLRAYWNPESVRLDEGSVHHTEVARAFWPPSMLIGLRRVLFLGLVEHAAVVYFRLDFYFIILYWVLGFMYIALLQRWGLAINTRSVGLVASPEYRSLWFKSIAVFLIVVLSLSLVLPKGIFTFREGVVANAIVNLVGNVHYRTGARQQGAGSEGEPVATEGLLQEMEELGSPPTTSRWIFLVIFLLQVIIVMVIPGIAIAVLIGYLLYSLIASEYQKLSGLPRIFVVLFLWFKHFLSRFRTTEPSLQLMKIEEQVEPVATTKVRRPRVKTFFHKLIQLCSSHGLQYKNSWTPFEYEEKIKQKWPEISLEASQVVKEHVVSKYSGSGISKDQSSRIEEYLDRIGKFFIRLKGESAKKKQEIPRL